MAQDSDGYYRSSDGSKHESVTGAIARDQELAGAKSSSSGGGVGLAGGVMLLYIGVPIAFAFLTALLGTVFTFFKFFLDAPLYLLVVSVGVFALMYIKRLIPIRILGTVLGITAMVVVFIFGFSGATKIYDKTRSKRVYHAKYSADYIQALPDGSAPILYSKRYQKGENLGTLEIGEKVKINGLDFTDNNFNITRKDGTTGWVDLGAFPSDTAVKITFSLGADAIGIDREFEQFIKEYKLAYARLFKQQLGTATESERKKQQAYYDSIFKPVNAVTTVFYINGSEVDKGEKTLADSGYKATFEKILYAENYTAIYLTIFRKPEDAVGKDLFFGGLASISGNTKDWHNALTLTDLDTGEKWKPTWFESLEREWLDIRTMKLSSHVDVKDPNQAPRYRYMIFLPPLTSKHFSLTHEGVLPYPKNGKGKYIDWNFEEIRVK